MKCQTTVEYYNNIVSIISSFKKYIYHTTMQLINGIFISKWSFTKDEKYSQVVMVMDFGMKLG